MNRKRVFSAVISIALVGALLYFYGGGQTPQGQPPLTRLTTPNATDVKSAFNAAEDDVRVLVLVSPT